MVESYTGTKLMITGENSNIFPVLFFYFGKLKYLCSEFGKAILRFKNSD